MKTEATATDSNGSLRSAVCHPALKLQSDERLVRLARSGSGPAFEVIVERYRSPLLSYCRRLLGPDRAQDVVQETFASALTSLRRDNPPVRLKPWLYQVAHNEAIDALRSKAADYEQLDENYDGVRQPPDVVETRQNLWALVEQIRELPDRWRSALLLRELEGRSVDEIAHDLECTPAGAQKLVERARMRLRDSLGLLIPLPLLRLFAAPSANANSARIADLVGAGGSSGLAKAGAALVAAGTIALGASATIPNSHDGTDSSRARAAPITGPVADARQPEGRAAPGNRDSRGRAPGRSGRRVPSGQAPPSGKDTPNGTGRSPGGGNGGGGKAPSGGDGSEDAPATAPGGGTGDTSGGGSTGEGGGNPGGAGNPPSAGSVYITGTTLRVDAGAGQVNSIRVSAGSGTYTVDEANGQVLNASAAAASSSSACAQISASRVSCPSAGVGKIEVHAGDQDDFVAVSVSATVYGGSGNDVLSGSSQADRLVGDAGDDVLSGGGGDDWIVGSSGDDTLNGQGGNDFLFGLEGNDTSNGGEGNDALTDEFGRGSGRDTLNGGLGADKLDGGSEDDTYNGGPGSDELFTRDQGDDRSIDCGAGRDTLYADPAPLDASTGCE